jgi:hypothetical protein
MLLITWSLGTEQKATHTHHHDIVLDGRKKVDAVGIEPTTFHKCDQMMRSELRVIRTLLSAGVEWWNLQSYP